MDANLPGTFLLSGPSLAPFPEAKAPVCQYSVQSSFYKLGPPGLGAQLAAGTPHGISDILGRPTATPNSSLLPSYPHTGGFNGLSSPGVYYGPQVGALPKASSDYVPRGRSCWAEAPDWQGSRQCGGRKYGAGRGWAAGGTPSPPLLCARHSLTPGDVLRGHSWGSQAGPRQTPTCRDSQPLAASLGECQGQGQSWAGMQMAGVLCSTLLP